jgi:hypothetical protein
LASPQGYDPCPSVLETDVQPITPERYLLFFWAKIFSY